MSPHMERAEARKSGLSRPDQVDQYKLGRLINQGGWGNGDVYEATDPHGDRAVIKTYRGRRAWIGKILVRREIRAYERLRGVPGIPDLLPSASDDTLALADVNAKAIVYSVTPNNCALVRARLEALATAMHQRRVYHMDLRNRGNILIDAQSNPYIVDFASAVTFSRSGWISRTLERWCLAFDRYGLSKWLSYCDSFSQKPSA